MAWHKKHKDPFFKREKSKYEHPVPSREYLMTWLEGRKGPATFRQLVKEFGLKSSEELEAFRWRLKAMERDGQLVRNRRGGYGVLDKMDLVRGRVFGHPEGFGFLIPDESGEDLFLSTKQMRAVFHGDRVLARVSGIDRRGRKEGAIVEILERANTTIVGRFLVDGDVSFVEPDNKRITSNIFIPADSRAKAKHGQIVVAEILSQPTKRSQAVGAISEVLGDELEPGMEIDVAIRSHGIPYNWPDEVTKAAKKLPTKVRKADLKDRVDLRDLPLVTIDGEDARDFDDAVYCQREKRGGWRLYVAIADVAHYVTPDDDLDKEAKQRGNSVYFPEQVIPMLPEAISNGLCSLNPEVDRLCMVCEMRINDKGRLTRSKIYNAVMHSKARLTYRLVDELLEGVTAPEGTTEAIYPHLVELYQLYQVLHESRETRGALDFDTTETRIVFGPEQKIESIVEVFRKDSHRMIEECMLLANVAVAKFLEKHKIPTLYRVHSGPDTQKIDSLRGFLSEMGYKLQGGKKPKPSAFGQLLNELSEEPVAHLVQTLLLRSLSQAVYSPKNIGHFGLAYKTYAHFTSPIRRYPDLLVHRCLKHLLQHGSVDGFRYDKARMERFGEHCSMTERRADDATRDAIFALKCEYMLDKVGEDFQGTISGVTGFGFFVELDDIFVDGLVHISSLESDYYHFDSTRQRLTGQRTGSTYHLGDRVEVTVANVRLEDKKIDFVLA